jgi:hypothetical protein
MISLFNHNRGTQHLFPPSFGRGCMGHRVRSDRLSRSLVRATGTSPRLRSWGRLRGIRSSPGRRLLDAHIAACWFFGGDGTPAIFAHPQRASHWLFRLIRRGPVASTGAISMAQQGITAHAGNSGTSLSPPALSFRRPPKISPGRSRPCGISHRRRAAPKSSPFLKQRALAGSRAGSPPQLPSGAPTDLIHPLDKQAAGRLRSNPREDIWSRRQLSPDEDFFLDSLRSAVAIGRRHRHTRHLRAGNVPFRVAVLASFSPEAPTPFCRLFTSRTPSPKIRTGCRRRPPASPLSRHGLQPLALAQQDR